MDRLKELKENLLLDKNGAKEEFQRLVDIIELLRKECPWDKEQTHKSIRACTLEETYELCQAIDEDDMDNMCEELGDVILQAVFHSNLARENESFDIEDVLRRENHKMIRRHPHIFFEENRKTVDKVIEKWDNIKRKEHNFHSTTDEIKAIAVALPSLVRSFKIQKKASKVGFDWEDVSGAINKLEEEIMELKEAISFKDKIDMEEELGDCLFALVNISRFLEIDSENALHKSNEKFIKRFEIVENLARKSNRELRDMSLEEMDVLWREAKVVLKRGY